MEKCEDCGKLDETVTQTICPFAEDVHNTIVEITVCSDCLHERAMDI